ncbi:MAG TPA: TetR/AcrR family transcriptional regulator [Candidatus Dormibacteraeota bacterium]|nr:TetR/AcrR family transcriptional regulator [Candidatus Dormibacteraeota bacterium]
MQTTARAPHLADRGPKGVRTREQLFAAALAEFRRVGVEAAAIGDIARRAGTSRASFYFHYPCKEAVLLDLQWRVEHRIVERVRERRSLREALAAVIDGLIEAQATLLASGDLLRAMLSVYIRRPPGLDLAEQSFPLMMQIGRCFAAAKGKELRRGVDPALATQLFLTSLFGLVASSPQPLAERRDELRHLAALFLESPRRPRRRA